MWKFCTDLPGYSSENFPSADNGCFFQPPDILDFSKSLVDDKFFESLEIDGSLHFPASDSNSSQPNKIDDCQAKKSCTDLPGYSPENFPAADNETFFQVPEILDSSESLIDAKLFEELEMDGDLHFPASGSGQPNKIGDFQAKKQTGERSSRKRKSDELGVKVAFKTMSDVEIMDDGYRWRKYGKKMVKENQNPRNYYRCSHGGCDVKKRVERDREDPRFVITTYEGMHTHECPYVIYYITPQNAGEHVGFNAAQIPLVSLGAPYAGRQGFYLSNYIES